MTLACAAIGFADDFIKLTHRRSLGLSGRWKLLLLGAVTVGIGFAAHDLDYKTSIYIPILNVTRRAVVVLVRARSSSSWRARRTA